MSETPSLRPGPEPVAAPAAAQVDGPGTLLVVGAGLIGTSVGLAASRAGYRVHLSDVDPATASLAASLGAGADVSGPQPADLVVDVVLVAVPPAQVAAACVAALHDHPGAVVTHVCGVQTNPALEVEASGADLRRFVGGHPIAGREIAGPSAADADLFLDRPWAVCPLPTSGPEAVETVRALAEGCRARPVVITPQEHDRLLAGLSHTPQLVASALAATLAEMDARAPDLAGPGIRDTTRLADSPPDMWGQIAAANAPAVAAALRAFVEPLLAVAGELEGGDPEQAGRSVAELVRRGRLGRALLPGKHGRAPVPLATVLCVVPDAPGALARLLADIAEVGVNVEDLRVDHAPGQAVGTADLAVAPGDRALLLRTLRERGWAAAEGPGEAL